jgi:class 3 adenylate cyclase
MPRETVSLAILFADIVRSSQLYEIMGDKTAQRLIANCLSRLADVACEHEGSVIKTIGDAVMCTFPDAESAVKAAITMQQVIEKMPGKDGDKQSTPDIYIGIHIGPVIREDSDIFGDAVNLAARMVSLAKPQQILITEEMFQALTPAYQSSVRYLDKDTIKGKSGELKIYEYLWEMDDVTVMVDSSSVQLALQSCLVLKYGENTMKVDQCKPNITMGRHRKNDLVLNYERVSRFHARIEYRRGKFVLIDKSSNGTYVHLQDQDSIISKGMKQR